MNAPTKITAQNVEAIRAKREAEETEKLQTLAEAAAHYASLRRINLPTVNRHLLWASFYFHKANYEYFETVESEELFDEACNELGVDRDGEPRAGRALA